MSASDTPSTLPAPQLITSAGLGLHRLIERLCGNPTPVGICVIATTPGIDLRRGRVVGQTVPLIVGGRATTLTNAPGL